MTAYRSHLAADLGLGQTRQQVRLAGWVARVRDLGGISFFDLRDGSGLVQVVVDPAVVPAASGLRMEYCVAVRGTVQRRPEGTENPDLETGDLEVAADGLEVLSRSAPLPFMIDDRSDADEQVRLRHRYLDLRRPRMSANLRSRSRCIRAIRETLDGLGFLDVETPTLVNSTPEGARDFLVPSRLRPGHFFALPQSPQLFKQLLMVAGVERYYQIARCYRDEDTRADRQVEFTQLDLEGAFWGRDDVFAAIEEVVAAVVERLRGVELPLPLARLTHREALARYGTDKPDLRFGMPIADLSEVFGGTGFRGFGRVLGAGGVVRGINAGARDPSRAELDGLVVRAKSLGAAGLVWAVVQGDGRLRSPVAKFLSGSETTGVARVLEVSPGDVLLLVADREEVASTVLGTLRLDLGRPEEHEALHFAWIVDFPVFDRTEQGDLVPSHHPFTAPVAGRRHAGTALGCRGPGLRPGFERVGAGVRLGTDPRPGRSAGGLRDTRYLRGGGRVPLRVVPRGSQVRDPSPRRFRYRYRPTRGNPPERVEHPGGDPVPQDAEWRRSAHHRPYPGGRCPVARTRYRLDRRHQSRLGGEARRGRGFRYDLNNDV